MEQQVQSRGEIEKHNAGPENKSIPCLATHYLRNNPFAGKNVNVYCICNTFVYIVNMQDPLRYYVCLRSQVYDKCVWVVLLNTYVCSHKW